MRVVVKLGAPLSQVVGERNVKITMQEGATVADVFVELRDRYPDFDAGLRGMGLRQPLDQILYTLFINARFVPFEQADTTRLRDGDRIYLFLPVGGG